LLCRPCEEIINKYENYGVSFFRGRSNVNFHRHQNGVTFKNINYPLLKQYLVSIIWRASVAQGKIFKKIILPPGLEEKARKSLLNNKVLGQFDLPCRIQRLEDSKASGGLGVLDYKEVLMAPFKRVYGNNISYYFLLEGFFFEFVPNKIKIKNRKTKGLLSRNKIQLFPYIYTPDVPEIAETLYVAHNKNNV